MKGNNILIIGVLLLLLAACQKGDPYYENVSVGDSYYDGTILEFLESNPQNYDSLLLALDMVPQLRKRLGNIDSQTTFFATTNSSFVNAFEALNIARKKLNKKAIYIEDIPFAIMDTTLNKYAIPEIFLTKDIETYVEGKVVQTQTGHRMHMIYEMTSASGLLEGGQQRIKYSDTNNSIFHRYWQHSFTSVVNIKTKNGVVHILAPSHSFSFSKFTILFQ